jgi:DNA-binding transcriptional LysR family regulator
MIATIVVGHRPSRPVDTALLKTFLEVARTRHFGKAADRLCVTQSAVSARIKLLEGTLGVELFTRKRNDIQLTPAGFRLLRHAETIVTSWERARQDIALEPVYQESLAVGCSLDLWGVLLRGWVVRVCERMPHLALTVETQPQEALMRRLTDGVLDLALLFEPPRDPELRAHGVSRVPLVLVSTRPGLTAAEALRDDYVLVDWGAAFAVTHSQHFPDMAAPRLRMGFGTLALDVLLDRGGAAYLAEPTVAAEIDRGTLFPVMDAPVLERQVYAVVRPVNERMPIIERGLAAFSGA